MTHETRVDSTRTMITFSARILVQILNFLASLGKTSVCLTYLILLELNNDIKQMISQTVP